MTLILGCKLLQEPFKISSFYSSTTCFKYFFHKKRVANKMLPVERIITRKPEQWYRKGMRPKNTQNRRRRDAGWCRRLLPPAPVLFQSTKVTRTFLEISGWVADFLAVSPGGRIISELICRIIISCHRTKRLVPGDAVKHLLGDCPASQRSQFYRMGAAWANMTVKNKEEWLHH